MNSTAEPLALTALHIHVDQLFSVIRSVVSVVTQLHKSKRLHCLHLAIHASGAEARNRARSRAYRRCMLASAYSCGDKSFSRDRPCNFGLRDCERAENLCQRVDKGCCNGGVMSGEGFTFRNERYEVTNGILEHASKTSTLLERSYH
jgi:hypothetical protein